VNGRRRGTWSLGMSEVVKEGKTFTEHDWVMTRTDL